MDADRPQTSSEEEARDAYVKAAEIMPGSTEPYEGLASVYRSDQVFTTGEEQQLRAVILPSLGELRANENYARMAFDIGKLYWYNYARGRRRYQGHEVGAHPGRRAMDERCRRGQRLRAA